MSDFVRGLKCRLCGKAYPQGATYFCPDDFGPLEVAYDLDALADTVSRAKIELRPFNMWRYRELLPVDGEPSVGPLVGGTPLVKATRLAEALGVKTVWVKNDAVNFPTLSFKDRVVSVALSKAREFGFTTVGCASTGNLANSVAPTPPPRAWRATSSSRPTWSRPRSSAPASTAPTSLACTALTTRSTGFARRLPSSTGGGW